MSDTRLAVSRAPSISLHRSYLMIALAGIIMVALILYGYENGRRLNDLTSPLLTGVREIRLETAAVEHEVKEGMQARSGRLDPNVWTYLDLSVWYLENLMMSGQGGVPEEVLPAGDRFYDRLGVHLKDLKKQLSDLKTYPGRQAAVRPSLGETLLGYDHLLMAFRRTLDDIEALAAEQNAQKQYLFQISHLGMVLFCIAMILAVAFTVRRYERFRAASHQELNRTIALLNRQFEERERAEKALRGSEDRFRGLFESAADFIHILDLNERILLSNPAAVKRLGYAMEDLQGRPLSEFFDAPAEPGATIMLPRIVNEGHFSAEVRLLPRNGRAITVDCSAFPVRDDEKRVHFIVVFQKDISDRKLAEQKLHAAHAFLQIANRHRELRPMMAEFLTAIRSQAGCTACAVRVLDLAGSMPYIAAEGLETDFCALGNELALESATCMCARVVRGAIDPGEPGVTPFGSFYSNHFTPCRNDAPESSSAACNRTACNRKCFRTMALIPIRVGDQTLGLIQFADPREDLLDDALLETLERAAMQIGPAIQRIRSEEALKSANRQLEDRVDERTRDLLRINQDLQSEVEERRRVEARLRESRDTLQTVIDGVKDALILVDRGMRIRMLNRVAAYARGIARRTEVIGDFFSHPSGWVDSESDSRITQAVAQSQTLTFERRDPLDPERMEQVSIYPVAEQEGMAGGAIVRIADITEEKRFERQLIKSEKMASLGILVSSIAHEINNPNNFVSFNIPILQDYLTQLIQIADEYAETRPGLELFHMTYPEFRTDVFKLVENIQHGSSRISTFVANLREFSQSNGSRRKVWLELPAVVEKVISICRSQVKKRVKHFELSIPADQPPIYADEYSLEQVLLNLIVNAAQAADKPEAFIRLSASSGGCWRDHSIISVTDNGCGMDERTTARIFDPFFTTKSASEGTGLGLYVCHNLVQSLGGRIEVQSQPGIGSTFSVFLPDKERRNGPRAAAHGHSAALVADGDKHEYAN